MPTREFYEDKAVECELMAHEMQDDAQRREWLLMAREWRLAALLPNLTSHANDSEPLAS